MSDARDALVKQAVTFLSNAGMKSMPWEKKKTFLEQKGLTIPFDCGSRHVATLGGLAGSTGRDFDARFWQSARMDQIIVRLSYKSSIKIS